MVVVSRNLYYLSSTCLNLIYCILVWFCGIWDAVVGLILGLAGLAGFCLLGAGCWWFIVNWPAAKSKGLYSYQTSACQIKQ